jgi:glycosyltransferase involved in cell wall biosynthesis
MRVLYDHQTFQAQEYGGISRYFAELIQRNPEARLALEYSDNAYIRKDPRFAAKLREKNFHLNRFLGGIRFRGKHRVYSCFRKATGIRYRSNVDASIDALEGGDFDLFHPTYYDPYFLERIGDRPFVLTIHDMIHEKYPELFQMGDMTSECKKRIALKAALIIAVSENTKRDIIGSYGIDARRIRVVYHGSNLPKGSSSGLDLPREYILFTGTREGYKNFSFFVISVAELLRDRAGLFLVCTGPRFSRAESAFLAGLGIEDKVIHRFFPEGALYRLYEEARCLVFPSYYEGFGIPILEAFEAGCPALLARASCFPEIAGDAALFFDPKDRQELLGSLVGLLDSEALRRELAAKGRRRLRDFSWDDTYERTMSCYSGIL